MSTFLVARDGDIAQVIDTRTNKARHFIIDEFLKFYTDYVKGEYLHFTVNTDDANFSSVTEELLEGTMAFKELRDKFLLESVKVIYRITVDKTHIIYADKLDLGIIGDPMNHNYSDFIKRFSEDYSSGRLCSPKTINVIINDLIETYEKAKLH